MAVLSSIIPGLCACFSIALLSLLVSSLHPAFDALLISLILGIIISNLLGERELLRPGVEASTRFILPLGIGLYGSQMSLTGQSISLWPWVLASSAVMFAITFLTAKAFGISGKIPLLMSAGMSICGAGAIAVVSGIAAPRKEETSISILAVMTIGLMGMLFLGFNPQGLGLTTGKFAFVSGATLPSLGLVKVAASAAGEDSCRLAMAVKYQRMSLLGLLAMALMLRNGGLRKIPWFFVMFIVLALAANFWLPGAFVRDTLSQAGNFMLAAALAGVGLSVDFDAITEKGPKPVISALLSLVIVVLIIYLALNSF